MEEDSSAEFVTFTDASGNECRLTKYDGHLFPEPIKHFTFHENTRKLHELNVCQDDVLILGYPKSGTHWVYEMVGMLLSGSTETIATTKEVTMLEIWPTQDVNNMPSPRILNTHYWPKYIPLEVLSKCKVVYLLRNPKDIVVSYHHHVHKMKSFYGDVHDYLGLFMEGKVGYDSWFGYVKRFEQFFKDHAELNPLIMYYEDINKDPLDAVKKLAQHLNVDYPEEFLKGVAEECHIDKMKVNNATKRRDLTADVTADGKSPMYRKGKVGDWKNWFTVAESERFDVLFREEMKGSTLEIKFELNTE